jgi:hypothetical protein
MTAVRFTPRYGGLATAVNFAYDPTVVAAVKSVPSFYRSYDPATKTWTIDGGWAATLAAELRALGHTVVGRTGGDDSGPSSTSSAYGDDDSWARDLLRRVGADRVDAVYRALTRVLHPDAPTGDTQLQRELNRARDAVRHR